MKEILNTKTFNENFTIDRAARGVKALPKNTPTVTHLRTADGEIYDASRTYYFFDRQGREIRQSVGLREKDGFLSTFGLKVVAVSKLRADRNDALTDGQTFFRDRIEDLQASIEKFEIEKTTA